MTIHIWPYNWKWTDKDSLNETLDYSIKQTQKYIKDHLAIAEKYNKPIVIEEFGYPRDSFLFDLGTLTSNRDAYYASVFQNVVDGSESNGNLAGCNFWAWGGMAEKKTDVFIGSKVMIIQATHRKKNKDSIRFFKKIIPWS